MPIEFSQSFWQQCWASRRGVHADIRGAILAAGLGRRMEPLTDHLPKPLFPLGGKVSMAELWVRALVASGITDVSMNLCVLGETIKSHFQDGTKFAARIGYVEEDVPSGTLGGVCKQALGAGTKCVRADEVMPAGPKFAGSTLIVPSGDIATNFDAARLEEMYDVHKRAGAACTVVLVPVPWERRKDFGTVILSSPETRPGLLSRSGRIEEFREKDPDSPSNLNNASIYMLEMELLEALDALRTEARPDLREPFYDFGKHVFPAMLGRLPYVSLPADCVLWGVEYDGAWFDVGQKRDYLQVNESVLDGELVLDLPYEKLPWGYLGNGVDIDFSRTTIHPPVVIGNGCVVGRGCRLGPYAVVGDGWSLEDGVAIRRSVLWERAASPGDGSAAADPHAVRHGVTIEGSIVVGGAIATDLREQTAALGEDGALRILPIDYVPGGERA